MPINLEGDFIRDLSDAYGIDIFTASKTLATIKSEHIKKQRAEEKRRASSTVESIIKTKDMLHLIDCVSHGNLDLLDRFLSSSPDAINTVCANTGNSLHYLLLTSTTSTAIWAIMKKYAAHINPTIKSGAVTSVTALADAIQNKLFGPVTREQAKEILMVFTNKGKHGIHEPVDFFFSTHKKLTLLQIITLHVLYTECDLKIFEPFIESLIKDFNVDINDQIFNGHSMVTTLEFIEEIYCETKEGAYTHSATESRDKLLAVLHQHHPATSLCQTQPLLPLNSNHLLARIPRKTSITDKHSADQASIEVTAGY